MVSRKKLASASHAVTACRLCGSARLERLYSFGKQPVAGYLEPDRSRSRAAARLELAIIMCRGCHLVQQASRQADRFLLETVYRQYQPTYDMSAKLHAYIKDWVEHALADSGVGPGELIVEIGANDGSLLDFLRGRGFAAAGFEPSPNLAEIARRRGVEVLGEYFGMSSARGFLAKRGPVKLVLTRHTLEHALDPGDFIRGLYTILAPAGLAVIEVPNLRLQLMSNQLSSMTFQHTSFFSVDTLSHGLREAGLVTEDVRFVSMDGGSMVVRARKDGQGEPSASVVASTALENVVGLDRPSGLRPYFDGVGVFRRRARSLIRTMVAQGFHVVGYGAGSKGQALINMLDLDRDDLPFVIDDSPGSAGRYIPGTGIEVLSSRDDRACGAEVVFITAPTHAAEIIEKDRARRGSAARYLVTTPDLHFATA